MQSGVKAFIPGKGINVQFHKLEKIEADPRKTTVNNSINEQVEELESELGNHGKNFGFCSKYNGKSLGVFVKFVKLLILF